MNIDIPVSVIWASLGIILLAAEVFTGTFFVMFFGISALIVAAATFLGLDHRPIEITLFAGLGLMSLLFFRKKLIQSITSKEFVKGDANEIIKLTTTIEPHDSAKVTYQGTTWTALNNTGTRMMAGERVQIEKIDGVKIILKSL